MNAASPEDRRSVDPRQARVVVLSAARNLAAHLASDVQRLQLVFGCFADLRWFVVESDSDDATVRVLQDLKSKVRGFDYVSLGRLRDTIPKRTGRIACARNRALEQLDADAALDGADYVIVVDLDGMNALLTQEALLSCWQRTDWDMVSANQRGPYYDVWALRHTLWSPNDCWALYRFLVAHGAAAWAARDAAVHARMLRVAEDTDWIEVDSAFGGLAIYRRTALRGLRYFGLLPGDEEICEHVPLHGAMRAAGSRLFINPRLVNTGWCEHTTVLRFGPRRWALRALLTARTLAGAVKRSLGLQTSRARMRR